MKNLLVVIDMVNGFVHFGALADKKINKITPKIINLIKTSDKNRFEIIAFKDCHEINDEEFKAFPPHCIKGTEESELIPELKPFEDKFDYIINKNTTNGFITKEFQYLLKRNQYNNVIVCGCCTDICVSNFVESYINFIKANNLNTKIYVVENACYTFDSPEHSADLCHKNALENMAKKGAKIVTFGCKNQETNQDR